MDITELNKVATRKRMSSDVEKLREKISKENKKIIKLKVAQDTAYWDLKEKLRQVETNHEKLQQNMLEVQMQYETVSGQYQDELRHRAETLNKLASTREICSVLEDYCERLRDTLARCKTDQAALYEAFQQSGQVLKDLKTQQVQLGEKSRQTIDNQEEKLKITTEHYNQLRQYFNEEKQRLATELQEEKKKLSAVLGKNNELLAANTELGALVDQSRRELEKQEEVIMGLQRDIKQLIQQFNSQASEMKNSMLKQEKELREATSASESLKQALHNQEAFTKTICDQNNQLQEKLVGLEDEQANAGKVIKELEVKLQVTNDAKEALQIEIENLSKKNSDLEKDVSDKCEIVTNLETEIQKLSDQLLAVDIEKAEVKEALDKACEEARALVTKVQELTESGICMEKKVQEIEDAIKAAKSSAESKISELTKTIQEKDLDLSSKASTLSHLMNEIKLSTDARASVESNVERLRQEIAMEKDSAGEMKKRLTMKIEQLEVTVRNKDIELSKNLNIIMELRDDKERLNQKIESMQSKIDNIQKALTRPAPAPGPAPPQRVEPEQDDNAVMLTPGVVKRSQAPTNLGPPPPRKEPRNNDTMLFNFMDSSDGDDNTLDANVVNRHFEAMSRGERLSPVLPALKRRRGSFGNTRSSVRHNPSAKDDDMMPLSQVKTTQQNKPRSFFKSKRHGQVKQKYEFLN